MFTVHTAICSNAQTPPCHRLGFLLKQSYHHRSVPPRQHRHQRNGAEPPFSTPNPRCCSPAALQSPQNLFPSRCVMNSFYPKLPNISHTKQSPRANSLCASQSSLYLQTPNPSFCCSMSPDYHPVPSVLVSCPRAPPTVSSLSL